MENRRASRGGVSPLVEGNMDGERLADPILDGSGPRFLTDFSSGKTFWKIPTPWIYPIAWDDPQKILEAKLMGKEELRRRFPEARAVHIWASSWFDQSAQSPAQLEKP